MTSSTKCILCGTEARTEDFTVAMMYRVSCGNCSTYSITRDAHDDLPGDRSFDRAKLHLISGYFRELNEKGLPQEKPLKLDDIPQILSHSWVPKSVADKANKLLLHIDRHSTYFQEPVEINFDTPAIAYCVNKIELAAIYHELGKSGLINKDGQAKKSDAGMARLTLAGAKEVERLKQISSSSHQCFVAMWFDESMGSFYEEYIAPAVRETGFSALRIDNKEHNDDICDNIIGEIRNSRFLIADFTGLRAGVYYEAGFAHGLGLPVIFTCREDWFNTEVSKQSNGKKSNGEDCECTMKEPRRIHFDLEHRNFIKWKDGPELQDKLIKRIKATISSN